MDLFRFKLVPESPWLTPWQSDTLSGLLCWAAARTRGSSALRQEIIEPALAGQPRFVLSDAFAADWMPLPVALRLAEWPAESRMQVKRARWLTLDLFRAWQRGRTPRLEQLVAADGWHGYTQLRNSISRSSGTTAGGGGLFPKHEWVLERDTPHLTVYARVDPAFRATFEGLVNELSRNGFGADVSAGKGQFRLISGIEPAGELDDVSSATGCVMLSTFQPGAVDPTDGCWEAFTKYGKLGPDFGVENVFKRPLIMLRPGACFRVASPRPWLGRAIPMNELLSADVAEYLRTQSIEVCHLAFGLSVPINVSFL